MDTHHDDLMFTVPLSFEAHSIAQKLHRQQLNLQKAKQVYLNTLAVYAVNFYLQCLGVETNLEQSDSHSSIALKFMDVADLLVPSIGKLECRPVLPESTILQIPSEASSGRVAYVAVRMKQSLKQAALIGFTQTAVSELPLSQLRSMAEFPDYLAQLQTATQQIESF